MIGAAGKLAAHEALEGLEIAMAVYDLEIVIGRLSTASSGDCLAKAGKKVLVLEHREIAGGQAVTEPFVDGEAVDPLHAGGQLRPDIVSDLGLAQPPDCPTQSADLSFRSCRWTRIRLTVSSLTIGQTLTSIGAISKRDAGARWPAVRGVRMTQATAFLDNAYRTPMPRLKNINLVDRECRSQSSA